MYKHLGPNCPVKDPFKICTSSQMHTRQKIFALEYKQGILVEWQSKVQYEAERDTEVKHHSKVLKIFWKEMGKLESHLQCDSVNAFLLLRILFEHLSGNPLY